MLFAHFNGCFIIIFHCENTRPLPQLPIPFPYTPNRGNCNMLFVPFFFSHRVFWLLFHNDCLLLFFILDFTRPLFFCSHSALNHPVLVPFFSFLHEPSIPPSPNIQYRILWQRRKYSNHKLNY